MTTGTIKIHQSVFVRDLVIEEKLTNCNANIIIIKVELSIEIIDPEDYKKADLYKYQRLVKNLIYLSYDTRPDIVFVVRQLSKHNADLRKSHL